jgi:hypothetical protein
MPFSIHASRPDSWVVHVVVGFVLVLAQSGIAEAQSNGQKASSSSYASWTGSETVQKSADDTWKTTAFTGFEYQGETDLDTRGDFDYWMVSAGVNSSGMVSDNTKIALKADYRAVGYDFSGIRGGVDPWETVHVIRLNPLITYQINDTWSVMGGPIGEFTGEEQAEFGDSLRGGGLIGFGYTRPKLFIAAGVLAMTEIEKDARIQPFVLVNWRIVDDLLLGLKADTSRGGELRLDYSFTDNFSLGGGIGVRRELFRLNDDDKNASGPGNNRRKDGVGEETATVLKITASYRINAMITIEGYGGSTVDGEFRLENEKGNKIASSDYDNSGFGGVNLRFNF